MPSAGNSGAVERGAARPPPGMRVGGGQIDLGDAHRHRRGDEGARIRRGRIATIVDEDDDRHRPFGNACGLVERG